MGLKPPGGKDIWSVSTIRSILSNEKYKGDALLQKTYTLDYLTKTVRKNKGEVKQYYVTNSTRQLSMKMSSISPKLNYKTL